MLRKLKISRFKSVREATLDFGRVNLFIGGNGTGKSNILEAIGMVSACLGRGLGDSDISGKGIRVTPPELAKSSFNRSDLQKTLKLEAGFSGGVAYVAELESSEHDPLLRFFSESATHSVSDEKVNVFGRSHRGSKVMGVSLADRFEGHRGIWDQNKGSKDIPKIVADVFDEFSKYVIFLPQADFLRGRYSGRVDAPPIGLRGEGLPNAVASFLEELEQLKEMDRKSKGSASPDRMIMEECEEMVRLPGWAKSFGIHLGDPRLTSRDMAESSSRIVYFEDMFMHAQRNLLSAYDSSEGTLFLLFAAIILAHPDAPKIFALDNVDNALNPSLTRKLVEKIISVVNMASEHGARSGAKQVFLTTQNPTALDAFDLFDDDQRIFVVRRNDKGHTTINRLEPRCRKREEWPILANGRNLSQLWLDGKISGALGPKEAEKMQ